MDFWDGVGGESRLSRVCSLGTLQPSSLEDGWREMVISKQFSIRKYLGNHHPIDFQPERFGIVFSKIDVIDIQEI